jgi:hypothetical protein
MKMKINQNVQENLSEVTPVWKHVLQQLEMKVSKKEIEGMFSFTPFVRERGNNTLITTNDYYVVFTTLKGDVLYVGNDREQALQIFLNKEKYIIQKA